MKQENSYINAVYKELQLRTDYINNETVNTIYFGGGTPSQLKASDLEFIFEALYKNYSIAENAEITIEANPDDLNSEYVKLIRQLPFNRISIGIQSFDDEELTFLKRRHSAEEAKSAVLRCKEAGFNNISIDLMYGLPNQTMEIWSRNLDEAIDLDIQHISSYHLIYEEKTKLFRLWQKGIVKNVDEEISVKMFTLLKSRLKEAEFMHYEISNFAKDGLISKHNSSYWLDEKYLGIGPSAHSFNQENRAWNIASISKYIHAIEAGEPLIEIENLDRKSRYNDYILTRMRTMWGVNLYELESKFGSELLKHCLKNISKHINSGDVTNKDGFLIITDKGILISDGIMSDLMYIE